MSCNLYVYKHISTEGELRNYYFLRICKIISKLWYDSSQHKWTLCLCFVPHECHQHQCHLLASARRKHAIYDNVWSGFCVGVAAHVMYWRPRFLFFTKNLGYCTNSIRDTTYYKTITSEATYLFLQTSSWILITSDAKCITQALWKTNERNNCGAQTCWHRFLNTNHNW